VRGEADARIFIRSVQLEPVMGKEKISQKGRRRETAAAGKRGGAYCGTKFVVVEGGEEHL